MLKSKKGLSDVVTTLIIILLALVAIGVIWIVVDGLLGDTQDRIDQVAGCSGIDLEITSTLCTTVNSVVQCDVSVKRNTGANSEAFTGVKMVFVNAEGVSSGVITQTGNIDVLGTETFEDVSTSLSTLGEGSMLTVYPYFTSEEGTESLCEAGKAEKSISVTTA